MIEQRQDEEEEDVMQLFPTLIVEQDKWSVKFHASTGRSYLVRLVETCMAQAGHHKWSIRPVALVENPGNDVLKAHFADPRVTEIFTCLEEMARRYNSQIVGYETEENS